MGIKKIKIGLFGHEYNKEKHPMVQKLFEKLNNSAVSLFVTSDFHSFLTNNLNVSQMIDGILDKSCFDIDFALSVGGDGTFLRTAAKIGRQQIPILGINTGRLGFLADVHIEEVEETLHELLTGNYNIEERMLLQLLSPTHPFAQEHHALNEVAILKQDSSSMISIDTFLNDEYLTTYQADGLVVATATGSTAYSLSVNGPIIYPQSDQIVLCPVAPHSLNVRPLVIPGTETISLKIDSRTHSFLAAVDGINETLPKEAEITIQQSDFRTHIIKRKRQSFYQTLREKLMWGVDRRVK